MNVDQHLQQLVFKKKEVLRLLYEDNSQKSRKIRKKIGSMDLSVANKRQVDQFLSLCAKVENYYLVAEEVE